jgi:hypothetical protein
LTLKPITTVSVLLIAIPGLVSGRPAFSEPSECDAAAHREVPQACAHERMLREGVRSTPSTPEAGMPAAGDPDSVYRIVVRFHVVRRSDGTGGIDETRFPFMMRDLNYGFRDTPFVFVREPGVTYIDNTQYYNDFPTFPSMIPMLNAHYEPGVLNFFITPSVLSGAAPASTWFGPPDTTGARGVLFAYPATGAPTNIVTPPHEAGHIFRLLHPGETVFGAECTSGVNCASAGDFVCDTPASPNVFGVNTTATGIYFANEPGPCVGDPPYNPNTRLYMEFGWPAGHILRNQFTPGQLARMNQALHTYQSDLIGSDRPDVLVDCDSDGVDDIEAILAGLVPDVNRDKVPDSCQAFPAVGDLVVCGMNNDATNRPRYYDGQTGAYRDTFWNGYTWTHQLRYGSDGLIYVPRLTLVCRLDPETGRTKDNFLDGVLDGASVLVDLLFTEGGDILTLDNVTGKILRYDGETGSYVGELASLGSVGMSSPKYMEYGPNGEIHVVGNGAAGNTIQRVDAQTGELLGSLITPGAGGLAAGQGLVFHEGHLYVSDGATNRVLRYDANTGAFVDTFVQSGAGGLSNPHSLRFGPDGHLYVASRGDNSVKRYDGQTGAYIDDFVASGSAGLIQPTGLLFIKASCDADLTGDETVDVSDLLALLSNWGTAGEADFDGDGVVGVGDLLLLLGGWGEC